MNAQMDWLSASHEHAKKRRDRGMKAAAEHADRVLDDWQERTYELLLKFIEQRGDAPFLVEEFRHWGRYTIRQPPDGRAFGSVIARARKSGIIVSIGARPAASSNRSLKVLWQRAPKGGAAC